MIHETVTKLETSFRNFRMEVILIRNVNTIN